MSNNTPEQKERAAMLIAEAKRDKARGVERSTMTHPLIDLNIRLTQYISMMNDSLEFLALQTLKDFRNEITVLQLLKIDFNVPVAMHDGAMIYVDPFINRDDYKSGGVEFFTFKKPLTVLGGEK